MHRKQLISLLKAVNFSKKLLCLCNHGNLSFFVIKVSLIIWCTGVFIFIGVFNFFNLFVSLFSFSSFLFSNFSFLTYFMTPQLLQFCLPQRLIILRGVKMELTRDSLRLLAFQKWVSCQLAWRLSRLFILVFTEPLLRGFSSVLSCLSAASPCLYTTRAFKPSALSDSAYPYYDYHDSLSTTNRIYIYIYNLYLSYLLADYQFSNLIN